MGNDTSADLAKLIKDKGDELGLDKESSSTIIGNLGGSVAPMCRFQPLTDEEEESDDHRLILLGFDGSTSMEDVADELVLSVNDVLVPALCDGVLGDDTIGGLRIGGLVFASKVNNLWGGKVQPIRTLPKVTRRDCHPGGMTALHQAALDLITMAAAQALQMSEITGTYPEVTLAILSDGDNNLSPMDADPVRKAYQKLSAEIFTTVFIGFETWDVVDFRTIANDLGFRDVQEVKMQSGEDADAQRKRFRNCMGVFSKQVVGRLSSSTVGVTAAANGSTGFWGDDD